MTERTMLDALAVRYAAPSYAFLEHVASGTGFAAGRTIDGVAMGVWPSRGLDLHGFEVKISRGDWRRELKKPEKAEGWRFDYFWIVAPAGVVNRSEVPKPWGLLELKGSKLFVEKEAVDLKPEPISRAMLAALMRKVHKAATTADDIAKARRSGFEEGAAAGDRAEARELELAMKQIESLTRRIADFEAASGVHLDGYCDAKTLGALVRTVRHHGPDAIRQQLQHTAERVANVATSINNAIAEIGR